METQNLDRFSELKLSPQVVIRNRVVVPAMASETATVDGYVTAKTLDHYTNLSNANTGIVMVEYTYVDPTGRSEENQLGISKDAHIQGLSEIADVIHKSGALAGLQLT